MKRRLVATRLAFVVVTAQATACDDENIKEIDNDPPVALIDAAATASPGAVFILNGLTSTDADGEVVDFAWDFGDGNDGDGGVVQHIYNAPGSFTVTLTVTDDDGATGDDTLLVVVDDNAAPVAVIAAAATGSIGASLRFDGAGSSDADGQVTAFDWDFDDGTTGAGPTFDKTFAAAGTYTVILTVTDDRGATGLDQHTIVVDEAPAGFDGSWRWFLTDESLRDLGFLCGGAFQDSQLTILTDAPDITITEVAGGTTVAYTGTLTGQDFAVSNVQFTITQEIVGTFTSSTEFTGFYKIDAGGDCADRPVAGTKQ